MSTDSGPASVDTAFHLDVPDVFHSLPLASDQTELDDQLAAMADELLPDAGQEMRRFWVGFSKLMVGAFMQADTRYAGLCCERDDDSISPATLVVAVPQLSFDNPQVAAAGIVQVLGSGAGANDARVLNLPCGPAAVVVKERRLQLPDPAELGIRQVDKNGHEQPVPGGEGVLPVREAQMFIPHQPWQRMVLITLSTPAINDWDDYARIFIRIGRSVRFGSSGDGPPVA